MKAMNVILGVSALMDVFDELLKSTHKPLFCLLQLVLCGIGDMLISWIRK